MSWKRKVGSPRSVERGHYLARGGASFSNSIAWVLFAPIAALATVSPVAAESLLEAARVAITDNASRKAEAANVRATADSIAQAESGYLPTISLSAQYGWLNQKANERPPFGEQDVTAHPRGYGVTLDQNIWNGLKTVNTVRRERESYYAARERLKSFDQNILLDVVKVYLDVLRNQAAINLYHENRLAQSFRLSETSARIDNGLATSIDSDQTAAAYRKSVANEVVAQARFRTARARYALVVGHEPGQLSMPVPPRGRMPAALNIAIETASTNHPSSLAALHDVRAADANVNAAKADYSPTVSFQALIQRDFQPTSAPATNRATTIGGIFKLNFPIYQGGLTTATVRQADNIKEKQLQTLDYQRQSIAANVTGAWEQYASDDQIVKSMNSLVASARSALAAVDRGAALGDRSTLEVNDARATLLDARLSLLNAECDRVFDAFSLLAAMGLLEPEMFAASVPIPPLVDAGPVETRQTEMRGSAPPRRVVATGSIGNRVVEFIGKLRPTL